MLVIGGAAIPAIFTAVNAGSTAACSGGCDWTLAFLLVGGALVLGCLVGWLLTRDL